MPESPETVPVLTFVEERELVQDILNLHRQLVLNYSYQNNCETLWERLGLFAEACQALSVQRKAEWMEKN